MPSQKPVQTNPARLLRSEYVCTHAGVNLHFFSRMPNRCVAAKPDLKKGTVLHAIPYLSNNNPTAKKRRRQWINFVKQKWARWEPSTTSTLCSKHFKPEDYVRRYNFLEELGKAFVPRLIRDEIGEVPVPKISADPPPKIHKQAREHGESSGSRGTKQGHRSRFHQQVSKAMLLLSILQIILQEYVMQYCKNWPTLRDNRLPI